MKRHATVKQVWDSNGRRAATASASYCTSKTFGCNVWGSSTTMLNNNLENVTTMPIQINGEVYDLPKSESDINSYLNRTYYGTLDDEVKSQIDNHLWNVGLLGTTSGQTLETDVAQEKAYKWRGNIGLVNVSDYVRANSNMEKCGTKALLQNNVETCKKTNYMYSGVDSWTMSPMTGGSVWIMNSAGYLSGNGAAYSDVIQPVLYLIPDISLDGEGTAINPYTIVS